MKNHRVVDSGQFSLISMNEEQIEVSDVLSEKFKQAPVKSRNIEYTPIVAY